MEKNQNFSEWFDSLLINAKILDNRYPVKGFSVYRGWGLRILQNITRLLEDMLEETGHEPILFPVIIPEDTFAKEAEHIAGFETEVFWITKAGDNELNRRLLLRPTSETAIYPLFSYWIRSHADLPFKVQQSVTIYRYETKATRPLLRMREFLWNEAHTAHTDWEDSNKQIEEAIRIYQNVFNSLGLSFLVLQRPDFDKFPGAAFSIAFDAWNPDGKVNQIGTIHNLGRNFSKVFDIKYEDVDGKQKHVFQTCYGFGISRTLAAVISQHGDDHGLVLSPILAPTQVVIIPIPYKGVEKEVYKYAKTVSDTLKKAGIRVYLDDNEKMKPGEKFYNWELLGVPVRVEVGPKDLRDSCITLSRRDTLERNTTPYEKMIPTIKELFKEIKKNLSERSKRVLAESIVKADDISILVKIVNEKKIAEISWCGREECAEKIREMGGGEIRGYPLKDNKKPKDPCVSCGKDGKTVAYTGRAY